MPRGKAVGEGEIRVNRAPVLTLWAAVVAERLGHDRETALTLGKAVAGLNAVSKGRRLGIHHDPSEEDEPSAKKPARKKAGVRYVELLGRRIPVVKTDEGLRAVSETTPASAAAVETYLERKLGVSLAAARAAMVKLASSVPKAELEKRAYALYESFRPAIPEGKKGWGAKGSLDLAKLETLAKRSGGGRAGKRAATRAK